jgi:YD repeat-containing protein
MEAIITAATVLTMYFNAVNSDNANYMYNGEVEDGVINKIEVYAENDHHQMTQKMEYRYVYDEQGRLQDKEMMTWDEATKQWTKSSRLTYKYFKNGYNVEMSYWNAEKQQYDLPTEVTLYRSKAPSLTTVRTYRMNETQDNMYLSSSMLVMEPIDNRLLAAQ